MESQITTRKDLYASSYDLADKVICTHELLLWRSWWDWILFTNSMSFLLPLPRRGRHNGSKYLSQPCSNPLTQILTVNGTGDILKAGTRDDMQEKSGTFFFPSEVIIIRTHYVVIFFRSWLFFICVQCLSRCLCCLFSFYDYVLQA